MISTLTVLHIFVCIFLIAVVLLQRGKGAEIGAVFGSGASSTVFGSRGAGNLLTKLTAGAAVVFMLTSLGLAYLWTPSSGDALFQGSIGRTDLPGGDYDTLIHAIRTRLLTLPPETIVYPGHGDPSSIKNEAMGNPFLTMVE